MTFEQGDTIGSYRVVRLLGTGGMGAVYEVEHRELGVRYALKVFTRSASRSIVCSRESGMSRGRLRTVSSPSSERNGQRLCGSCSPTIPLRGCLFRP